MSNRDVFVCSRTHTDGIVTNTSCTPQPAERTIWVAEKSDTFVGQKPSDSFEASSDSRIVTWQSVQQYSVLGSAS